MNPISAWFARQSLAVTLTLPPPYYIQIDKDENHILDFLKKNVLCALGLERKKERTSSEIKKAYHKVARLYHP